MVIFKPIAYCTGLHSSLLFNQAFIWLNKYCTSNFWEYHPLQFWLQVGFYFLFFFECLNDFLKGLNRNPNAYVYTVCMYPSSQIFPVLIKLKQVWRLIWLDFHLNLRWFLFVKNVHKLSLYILQYVDKVTVRYSEDTAVWGVPYNWDSMNPFWLNTFLTSSWSTPILWSQYHSG